MKNFSIISLLCLTLFSCGNAQEIADEEAIPALPKAIVTLDVNSYSNSASTIIENVLITKNKMTISIKYSGGCKEHKFQLIGSKLISKSIPPQRSIQLYHDNDDDHCRELIDEILVFDISDLAYDNNPISLKLDGYDGEIIYSPIR